MSRRCRIERLFAELCDLPPAEQRTRLRDACGEDSALLDEALELFEADRTPCLLDDAAPIERLADDVAPELERYRIVDRIGRGGMGTVYRAEQLAPVRRQVALKVLRPTVARQGVMRHFAAERAALAGMRHTGIAQVYDCGVSDDGAPFFAMELVDGQPITTFCVAHHLARRDVLTLFASICDAVQHAHEQGFVHCDLKPQNVLVTEQNGRPLAKVVDFGIARSLVEAGDRGTPTATIGTPHYVSPERDGSSPPTPRADVYSLGVVFAELLLGVPPTTRDHPLRGCRADQRRSRCRRDLEWIAATAMALDPAERYASAAEFAADARRVRDHLPLAVRGSSWGYRVARFVARRPALSGALVVAGIGIAYGLTMGLGARAVEANRREELQSASATLMQRARELEPLPGADGVRSRLLEDGVALVADALDRAPDDDGLKQRVLTGRHRRGKFEMQLGDLDDAEGALRAAAETNARADGTSLHERVAAELDLVRVLRRQRRFGDALQLVDRLLAELRAHDVESWPHRALCSGLHRERCVILSQTGRDDDAVVEARIALVELEAAPEPRYRCWHQFASADAWKLLGVQQGRARDAACHGSFERAIACSEQLIGEDGSPHLRHLHALIYESWSFAASRLDDPERATRLAERAVVLLDPLVDGYPDRTPYRVSWLRCREKLVHLQETRHEPVAARELLHATLAKGREFAALDPRHRALRHRVELLEAMARRPR